MDRFQVTSRLTEFWIDAGKSATITNIGSATVYGSPDAPPTSTGTAAWSLAPGASRTEDVGAVWVLTAAGTSSTLTVEPIASGLATDTGTGVPSAIGSGGSGVTIQDEGTPLTVRANLNFKGAGVTATDNSGTGATDITIPGGGGSSGYPDAIDVTASPYSAVGDGKRFQGTMSVGSAVVSSLIGTTTPGAGDIGKPIVVENAGTPITGTDAIVLNAATASTTGGTLAAGTYYYKVTGLNQFGESTGSNEVSITTTGSTSSVALRWAPIRGATSFRVYRGTSAGAESVYFTSASASFTDTGGAGTAGTVPGTYTLALPTALSTTIVSVGPLTLAAAAGASVSQAYALYGTDDTAAIQSAVNAAYDNKIARIYFPGPSGNRTGVYVVAGAFQTTSPRGGGPYRSQICLPKVNNNDRQQEQPLEFFGPASTTTPGYDSLPLVGGAAIASTSAGMDWNGTDWPSVIGGPSTATDFGGYTNVEFTFRRMALILPGNPRLGGLNLRHVQCAAVQEAVITTISPYATRLEPVHRTGQQLVMPALGNNTGCRIEGVSVSGGYVGVAPGEHTYFGQTFIGRCRVAISPSYALHAISGPHICVQHCPFVFACGDPSGGVTTINQCVVDFPCVTLESDDDQFGGGNNWGNRYSTGVIHIIDTSARMEGRIGYRNIGDTTKLPWRVKLGVSSPIIAYDLAQKQFQVGVSPATGYLGTWDGTGPYYGPPKFWMDSNGIVHLQGGLQNGTAGTNAFQLPVGMQPGNGRYVYSLTGDTSVAATSGVVIDPSGFVQPRKTSSGGNPIVLDGLHFRPAGYDNS